MYYVGLPYGLPFRTPAANHRIVNKAKRRLRRGYEQHASIFERHKRRFVVLVSSGKHWCHALCIR